jgi:hypothetical protein
MLLLTCPPGYEAERRYAAATVLGELLGLEHTLVAGEPDGVEITLAGAEAGERRLLLADCLFRTPPERWATQASLPRRPIGVLDLEQAGVDARVVSPRLPVLFGGELASGGLVRVLPDRIELGLDVFGSAFFMLTRLEEIVAPASDEHGRFPAGASLAGREGFLDRPIVDEYAELLWWALARLWPGLERRRRSFRLLVSHDVDHPRWRGSGGDRLLRAVAGDVVRRRDAGLALRRLGASGGVGRDVYDTFDWIMDASERRGLRSAFYLMAGAGGERDGGYSLEEPRMRALVRSLGARGHEIGLHGSYETFDDAGRLGEEVAALRLALEEEGVRQQELGGRQHFLRWRAPLTWRLYEATGLAYDTTLTFADRAGFRSGACFDHTVFDVEERRPLRLRERPLVAMEGSLLDYEQLAPAPARERLVELKRRCRLLGGDFTLLWHNSSLLTRAQRRLYLDVLDA